MPSRPLHPKQTVPYHPLIITRWLKLRHLHATEEENRGYGLNPEATGGVCSLPWQQNPIEQEVLQQDNRKCPGSAGQASKNSRKLLYSVE
ncbi:hypothetical protein F2P79_013289 [Pimephales promelas]|nr:hypothetical protein F2P79_013289 [Pimephales promelas]